MFRKTLFTLHLCLGLAAAVFLTVQGVTGAVLVFENELNVALNPKLLRVQRQSSLAPLAEVQRSLEGSYPGYHLDTLRLPSDPSLAGIAGLEDVAGSDLEISYDQYTAKPLGDLRYANNFARRVHRWHEVLWGGSSGRVVIEWSSVFLLVLSVSGLVLWWPRKIVRVKWKVPSRRYFDLHHAVGFYSAAFLFLFALTGVMMFWDEPVYLLLNRITHAPPLATPAKPNPPAPGQMPLNLDHLLLLADAAVPGATPSFVVPGDAKHAARVVMKYPEDHTPIGRTNVFLDAYSGAVLGIQNARTAGVGYRITRVWTRPVHTGDILGWPTRIVACVASLMLPVMAVTGPLLWWRRQRPTSVAARSSTPAL